MKPLATFVLYAYNEEKFIREAIESAFAQTYSPLEIVLSDDGSTDRTFEIMQEMAAAYRGPHKILLNRNEKNIGIGSQLNAAWQKSNGQLFILANGDDVSLPHRAAKTAEVWLGGEPRPKAITANLETMDAQGKSLERTIEPRTEYRTLEDAVRGRCGPVLAASLALDREVFDRFGGLLASLIIEDGPLFLRAMLLGPTRHIEECLVRYRIHKENISQAYAVEDYEPWVERHHEKAAWQSSEGAKAYLQMLVDLHSRACDPIDNAEIEKSRWAAMEKLIEYNMMSAYYRKGNTVPVSVRMRSLSRLIWMLSKCQIKRALPFIQARNDRWHYRRVVEAFGKKH